LFTLAITAVATESRFRRINKVRGEIQAAVTVFDLKGGVSGFVRRDTRSGDDLTAGGVRVGWGYQM
jgi:hypothetical protein